MKKMLAEKLQLLKDSKYMVILGNTIKGFGDDRVHKLSASLAYTTFFSLIPMLLLVVLIGGSIYASSVDRIFNDLKDFIGESAALTVQQLVEKIANQKSSSTTATIVSTIVLIVSATGLFAELQDSLNLIWGVRPKKKKGFIKFLLARVISFAAIIGLGLFLALMILINTLFIALSNRILDVLPELPINSIYWLNTIFLFFALTVFFALIFKILPDVNIKWKDVWGGSMLTSFLFLISKWFISLYIGNNRTVSLYEAAGSMVILLLWIYLSAFIFYFCAEYIRSVAEYKGRTIHPKLYAELSEKRLFELLLKEHNTLKEEMNVIKEKSNLDAVIDANDDDNISEKPPLL